MIKSKKQSLIVIGVFTLVLLLGSVTYAFFNYTRTGSANNFSVGRIYFKSDNEETISLNNLFPIDPSNATEMNDPTKVGTYSIDITGDTDYVDGLEYLVSIVDSNISNLPISIDVSVSNGLGTSNANYFTARESKNASIYKKLIGDTIVGDGMVLVGYVKPNTTSGVIEGIDGTITITAYLDKNKILISDTYDGTESDNMGTPNSMAEGKTVISTAEWNALSTNGISFKVRVEANEGIWVNGSLEEIMRKSAVMDNIQSTYVSASTGIDFGAVSSDTNGKGVYIRAGTENDAYPIMYYRGAVEDNNVVFNNKCWKAVRTTDTGGVKLIYNGAVSANKAPLAESDYTIVTNTGSFTFDSSDNTWTRTITGTDGSSSAPLEISFNVPAGDDYLMQISGVTSATGGASLTIYKGASSVNGTGGSGGVLLSLSYSYGTLTASDVIKMTYYGNGTLESPTIIKVKMIKLDATLGTGCDNTGANTQITLSGTNTFAFSGNNLYKSPAYNGYMWGTVYEYSTANWTSGARFGSGFTWDGTNYTLVDDSVTTPNATHHYSCNVTTPSGTCQELRYVYYGTSTKYYITLTDGDGIEEAISKMQTNTNPSNAKTQIDSWYASNMTSVTNKLEDTIWCNDRSMGNGNNNGWIANGGNLSTYLYYGAYQRSAYATNSSNVKNQPSLACANKNDAFTVKNGKGNQKLQYPVAMLTEDEMVLAGGVSGQTNEAFYLTTGNWYWSLSPNYFYDSNAYEFLVDSSGSLYGNFVRNTFGLRPSVSLKPGQPVVSGTGTILDPYVIG